MNVSTYRDILALLVCSLTLELYWLNTSKLCFRNGIKVQYELEQADDESGIIARQDCRVIETT